MPNKNFSAKFKNIQKELNALHRCKYDAPEPKCS